MFGEDKTVTPIVTIEAKIQKRVATFLSLKDKLVQMSKSPLITISDKAKELLNVQSYLENEMAKVYSLIEKVKSGVYTYSDVIHAGSFAVAMEKQIGDVQKLEKEFLEKGGIYKAGFPISWKWIIGGIAGLLGLFFIRKKL